MTPKIASAAYQFLQRCQLMPQERAVFDEVEKALLDIAQSQTSAMVGAVRDETKID